MEILVRHYGFVLVFPDKKDFKHTIDLLQGQLEHIEKNDVPGPHLMLMTHRDPVVNEILEKELQAVKEKWTFSTI